MKKPFLLTLTVLLALSCQLPQLGMSSEDASATEAAETQAAIPTATKTPTTVPTETATPTIQPSPTNTRTPAPTPDLRTIIDDPIDLALIKADLPADGKYFLPGPEWSSPVTNAELIRGWGDDGGQEYVDDTGRVNGHYVTMYRGTDRLEIPRIVRVYMQKFNDVDGAILAFDEYTIGTDEDEYLDVTLDLPVDQKVLRWRETQSGGDILTVLSVEFLYRNYVVHVMVLGFEDEVSYDYLEIVAAEMLFKLESATLSN
ncbi:MAG: hypothetical protein EPO32_02970 [Anaerolineae bacterium]|nr:MAG: hypothetical protein EPO32_02970 [Anaerolineae bacterium]